MDNKNEHRTVPFFQEDRKGSFLYHYTSMERAISIIATHSLLFSPSSLSNDMDESKRPLFCRYKGEGNDTLTECENVLQSYVQISFTGETRQANSRRGFDILTMWGHYADKGKGVCIVFDKKRIIENVNSIPNCFGGYVKYKKGYDCAVVIESDSPEDEIKSHINDLFFCKSDLWKSEQEFRIIKEQSTSPVDALDVSGCIEGVIYADEIPKNYWLLEQVCTDIIPIYVYDHRNIDGDRSLFRSSDRKEVWSTGEMIDLSEDQWSVEKSI